MKRMRKWATLVLSAAMVVTGIQVPVSGATDDVVIVTESVEENEETPVGADEYDAHVYSEKDFVSALNGTAKNIIIEKAFDLTKTVTISKDMTLQMAGRGIGADYTGVSTPSRAEDAIGLIVAAEKTVTITNDGDRYANSSNLNLPIVNNGTLTLEGVNIKSAYGPAIVNNGTLTTEKLSLTSDSTVSSADIDAVVVNNKNYIMSNETTVSQSRRTGVFNAVGAEFVMEAGIIRLPENNGIYVGVSNNGVFVQRGGSISQFGSGYGIGVTNQGTYTMQSGLIITMGCGVVTYNDGKFEMTGNADIGAMYIAVSTTAAINDTVSANLNSLKSGQFTMLNGNINGTMYGVVYTDSVPKLYGGTVYGDYAAVAKFGNPPFYPENFMGIYDNSEKNGVSATYVLNGVKYNSKRIEGGQVKDLERYETVSGATVKDLPSLQAAIASASTDEKNPSYIFVENMISISENLIIGRNKQIVLTGTGNGVLDIWDGKQISIEAGADVNIISLGMVGTVSSGPALINNAGKLIVDSVHFPINYGGTPITETTSIIENKGILEMVNLNAETYDSNNEMGKCIVLHNASGAAAKVYRSTLNNNSNMDVGVSNNGTLEMHEGNYNGHDYGIYNAGSLVLDDEAQVQAGLDGGIGIYNTSAGSVKVSHGTVFGKQWGIVYEGTAVPALGAGEISAADKYAVGIVDSTKASSEWASGQYKNLLSGSTVTNCDQAKTIRNGIPVFTAQFTTKYLLMNKGEQLTLSDVLTSEVSGNFVSSDPTIVSISDNRIATAEKTGYATIEYTTYGNVKDFMRIEVAENKGSLSTKDYEGNLLESDVKLNAYRKETSVPFGFNLKSSKDDIYTGSDLDDLKEATLLPSEIVINDSEFCDYFEIGQPVFNTEMKQYYFSIQPKLDRGETPKTVNDEVKSIQNVKVFMKMASQNNVPAEEMIEIGTMNLSIDTTQPTLKFRTAALESAFNANSERNHCNLDSLAYNTAQIGEELAHVTFADFVPNSNFSLDGSFLSYTGPAKKLKTSIPVKVKLNDYFGIYSASIPVVVNNTKPVAAPVISSYTVAKGYDRSNNIAVNLQAKNKWSLSELKSAEIINKNSNFVISDTYLGKKGNSAELNGKTYRYSSTAITLAPKSAVTKAETIQIKLTYANTKAIKGKPYSTTIKIKVKPVSKFSIKPVSKTVTIDPTAYLRDDGEYKYDSASISFTRTPSNYTGASFVVTGYDGLEISTPELTTGKFTVKATNMLTDKKTKKVLTVKWVDDSTAKTLAETKVTVNFKAGQKPEIKTTKLTVKLAKNAVYFDKSGEYWYVPANSSAKSNLTGMEGELCAQATIDQMKAPLKLKESGTASYSGKIHVEDSRFQAGLWQLKGNKVVWAPYIQPTITALQNNMLIPGEEIATNLTREDELGNTVTQSIKIKLADVRSVKTEVNTKSLTLYKKSPYYEASIGMKPLNPAFDRIVNVTTNDSNYTVRLQTTANSVIRTSGYDNNKYEYLSLCYTNHNSTKITGKSYQKPVNLALKVTYASGKTGVVNVKVTNK